RAATTVPPAAAQAVELEPRFKAPPLHQAQRGEAVAVAPAPRTPAMADSTVAAAALARLILETLVRVAILAAAAAVPAARVQVAARAPQVAPAALVAVEVAAAIRMARAAVDSALEMAAALAMEATAVTPWAAPSLCAAAAPSQSLIPASRTQ